MTTSSTQPRLVLGFMVFGFAWGFATLTCTAAASCEPIAFDTTWAQASHLPTCAELPPGSYPPVGGDHYPVWARYQEYSQPLWPGFWLHNLEHGGVVLLYHCPSGCPEDIEALRELIRRLPDEGAGCSASGRRAILAPDPGLKHKVAVLTWGHSLQADCLDTAIFRAFMSSHYNQAPENVCSDGTDVLAAALCPPLGLSRQEGPAFRRPMLWQTRVGARARMEVFKLDLLGKRTRSKARSRF